MTETCLPIVTWLKNWFTSKDNEIHYDIISSNYNPNIGSTVTITVTVTDGDENTVPNHSFVLNANGTDVSLTTNSQGIATYTYTCSNWGICRFSVKTFSTIIQVVETKFIFQELGVTVSSTASQGTSSGTATVTACPTGYTAYMALIGSGWHSVSSWDLSNTTLTIYTINPSGGAHSALVRVLLIYFKNGAF